MATTFSLKQGETRTSHGPIPHPLISRIHSWHNLPIISGVDDDDNYVSGVHGDDDDDWFWQQ